jgi:hypothetical protein
MLRTGFYIMSSLTLQAKLLLYRHYVFVLDLFHILWCQPVLGFMECKIQFNSILFHLPLSLSLSYCNVRAIVTKARSRSTCKSCVLQCGLHTVGSGTYSERASNSDHCVLCADINRASCHGRQTQDGGDVDHHTTFASFVYSQVLEPQQGAPYNSILEQSGTVHNSPHKWTV